MEREAGIGKHLTRSVCYCAILVLIQLWSATSSAIESTEKGFTRIPGPVELTQNDVTSIVQDRFGFLWFGTQDGLLRYDGYNFSIFRHSRTDSRSLPASFVRTLHRDRLGRLWVGTDLGICLYDDDSRTFIRFPLGTSKAIYDIAEDGDGRLWVGTADGLYSFDESAQRFIRSRKLDDELAHVSVWSLAAGRGRSLWIGTSRGLANLSQTNVKLYMHTIDSPAESASGRRDIRAVSVDSEGNVLLGPFEGGLGVLNPDSNGIHWLNDVIPAGVRVSQIFEDSSGLIWLGTVAHGIVTYDPEARNVERMKHQPSDTRSISHDRIRVIYEDVSGLIWIGTGPGGVNRYDRRSAKVAHYRFRRAVPDSLSKNQVSTIHVDQSGTVWVGTFGGGLNRFDGSESFKHFRHDPGNDSSLSSDQVFSILVDRYGDLWVGTGEHGLNRYDRETGAFRHYVHNQLDDRSLAHNRVRVLYEDSVGQLWIGTAGGGLDLYDRELDRFIHHQHDPADTTTISENNVRFIMEDHRGRLWIGTSTAGVNRFDSGARKFTRFEHEPGNEGSLAHNRVQAMYESDDHRLWIGTPAGLTELGYDGEVIYTYTREDGLANDIVYCILGDPRGNLWLSTNLGISRFSPSTRQFQNYDVTDGLQANEFFAGSCSSTKDGTVMFGGVNGLTAFNPDDISKRTYEPKVALTELLVRNRTVQPGPRGGATPLTKPLLLTDAIELSHDQNTVAFGFAALDFASPSRIRYQYMLSGFDPDWIETSASNRIARYSNLPAGDYELLVRASNSSGHWGNEVRRLRVAVRPAPWLSPWAVAIYTAAAFCIGLAWVAAVRRRRRYLEDLVDERTIKLREQTQLAQQAVRARSIFLAKMSHEIRTPINAVIGMLQLLASPTLTRTQRDYVRSIQDSAAALMAIVDQILLFSRVEQKTVRVEKITYSPHRLFEGVSTLMQAEAAKRNLAFTMKISSKVPEELLGDPDKIRQVCLNLTANAIRFTERGSVSLSIDVESDVETHSHLTINVADTGVGMSQEVTSKVFDAFTQADSSISRQYGGTGLGLAIVRELVGAMGGTVNVRSELNVGSIFVVRIPLPDRETVRPLRSCVSQYRRVLLVEDVAVNRQIIDAHLESEGHDVRSFANGQDAVDAYPDFAPKLVVVDINMPGMDGLEVAQRIRRLEARENLPYTPIIALTAGISEHVQDGGLAAGINGMLHKPFDYQQLLSLLESICEAHVDPAWMESHSASIGNKSAKDLLREAAASLESECSILAGHLETMHRNLLFESVHKVLGIAQSFGFRELSAIAGKLNRLIRSPDSDASEIGHTIQGVLQTAAMTRHCIRVSGVSHDSNRDLAAYPPDSSEQSQDYDPASNEISENDSSSLYSVSDEP